MHADHLNWINPALEIIKRADPATYGRMQASPWEVHVISTGKEQSLSDFIRDYGPWEYMALIDDLETAFGVTSHHADGTPTQLTWLNKPAIEDKAKEMGVNVADFLASVIVHEFAHDEGVLTEKPAFAISTAFARKLGPQDEPIAVLSAATGRSQS